MNFFVVDFRSSRERYSALDAIADSDVSINNVATCSGTRLQRQQSIGAIGMPSPSGCNVYCRLGIYGQPQPLEKVKSAIKTSLMQYRSGSELEAEFSIGPVCVCR